MARGKNKQDGATRQGRAGALRFIAMFLLWGMIFYAALYFLMQSQTYQSFLAFNARASAGLISLFHDDLRVQGPMIATGASAPRQFTVQVAEGCDPLQPIIIFAAATLAMPVRWKWRLAGVLTGAAALLALNFVRIASLFMIGVARPDLFERMHLDVWQAGFVLIAFLLWGAWAHLAMRPAKSNEKPEPRAQS